MREDMNPYASLPRPSPPLVVLAADAPRVRSACCDREDVQFLATKILLLFYAARTLGCPSISSGLLGGGAYRGNRPLVLVLHMIIKASLPVPLRFHLTVLRSFSSHPPQVLQMRIRMVAESMLRRLFQTEISTMDHAITLLLSSPLPSSHDDADVSDDVCRFWGVPPPSSSPLVQRPLHSVSPSPLGGAEGPASCAFPGCGCAVSWTARMRSSGDAERTTMVCTQHLVEALTHDNLSAAIRL